MTIRTPPRTRLLGKGGGKTASKLLIKLKERRQADLFPPRGGWWGPISNEDGVRDKGVGTPKERRRCEEPRSGDAAIQAPHPLFFDPDRLARTATVGVRCLRIAPLTMTTARQLLGEANRTATL